MRALRALRDTRLRPELRLREVPGPARSAPFTAALEATLLRPGRPDEELADGRFVVLHDPAGREDWDGTFRLVTLIRAGLEPELGTDPLMCEVAWTWLTEALAEHAPTHDLLGGSVTITVDESFGVLSDRAGQVELEVRASWTPTTPDLGPHLRAWAACLGSAAGLTPLPDGVAVLRPSH